MGVSEGTLAKKSEAARHPGLGASGSVSYPDQSFAERIPKSQLKSYRKAGIHWPHAAMKAVVDQKALDVRALDISEASDIADYFVICSGTSERHVKGIADKLQTELAKYGEKPISVSGYTEGQWVVLDYGDLIVHVFFEPMRQHYGLDELWSTRSTEIEPPTELHDHMRMLKTGIIW